MEPFEFVAVILMWIFPTDTLPPVGFGGIPTYYEIQVKDSQGEFVHAYLIDAPNPFESFNEFPIDPEDLELRMGEVVEHPLVCVRTLYRDGPILWPGDCYEIGPVHPWGGDFNKDGVISTVDLGLLGQCWGPTPDTHVCRLADFNQDGFVGAPDLGIWGQFFEAYQPWQAER